MEQKNNNLAFIIIGISLLAIICFLGYQNRVLKNEINKLKLNSVQVTCEEEQNTPEENTNEEENTPEENEEEGEEEEEEQQEEEEEEELTFTEEQRYQALIASPRKGSVYQKTKVTAANISDEQIVLDTVLYMTHFIEKYKGQRNISVADIKKFAKIFYGVEVKNLPKQLICKNSMEIEYELKNNKYVRVAYNGNYAGYYENFTLEVVGLEEKDGKAYLTEKLIVNVDLANSGCGIIKKLDGSGKVTLGKGNELCGSDTYAKYPDYFTTYKHTFDISGDYPKYISTEIVK